MEYSLLLEKYAPVADENQIATEVEKARVDSASNRTAEVYRACFGALDLTTLSESDSSKSVSRFVEKVAAMRSEFPDIPDVASICVYPSFVDVAGLGVEGTDIAVTGVAGGFPASQTFLEVKMLEVAMAVESGADEIDVVINVGEMLEGEYNRMANDLELLRREAGEEVVFKVIVESGALKHPDIIRNASLLAMYAGADFVKTSTGKIPISATPEAAVVMCRAIKDFYCETGRKVGFKAAGGIRTVDDAILYYTIVKNILGEDWLTPRLFRIGASSLANELISAIAGREVRYF